MKKITLLLMLLFGVFASSFGQFSLCGDAVSVSLPYTTTDNTSNYADLNYEGSPGGATGCSTAAPYLNGNDVVYAYTATANASINIRLTTPDTYVGMFVYTSCASIGTACVAGDTNANVGGPLEILEFTVVTGQTYYIVISTWPAPDTAAYTLNISENTCTNPTATYTIVPDCANGSQFLVDVNVTNLGTATSLTVTDSSGNPSQALSAPGIVTFGPYPNASPITITIANDQDANCVVTSPAQNLLACPPANDTCAGAIDLLALTSPISSSTAGALNDNTPTCSGPAPAPDVYYSILVPSGSTLTIGQTANAYDSVVSIFYGDCATRTAIACFDDPDTATTVWANTTGSDQTVYYVQDGFFGTSGAFTLAWSLVACSNATATYAVISDCTNGAQFLVDVNVTSLGSATSVTVSNSAGSPSQSLSAPGIVTFGPFPNAAPVTFTVTNDQDGSCAVISAPQNQLACPPANDTCANAIDLATQTSPLSSSTVGALNDNTPTCSGTNPGPDVYYSILVPSGSTLTIGQTINGYDSVVSIFYGDCATPTAIACYDDPDTATTVWPNTTGSDQTVYYVQDGYFGASGTFTLAWSVVACSNATATYAVISDCTNGAQFLVDVNVTNLGSATSVTVTNNAGTPSQSLSAAGVVTFGPFPNATPVIFTVTNNQDSNCAVVSAPQNQIACPPANDLCENALPMTITGDFASSSITVNTTGATRTATNPVPTCGVFGFVQNGKDVWYQAIATASGNVVIETASTSGSALTDTVVLAYTGDCTNLVQVGCDDDSGADFFSRLSLTGLTAGTPIFIRVFGFNGSQGTFTLGCFDATLANNAFENAGFSTYPNPVVDILNLSYSKNIDKVQVLNLIGQEVIVKSNNTTDAKVDMSALASGTYLVKVTSDNQIKTLKIIKQ